MRFCVPIYEFKVVVTSMNGSFVMVFHGNKFRDIICLNVRSFNAVVGDSVGDV